MYNACEHNHTLLKMKPLNWILNLLGGIIFLEDGGVRQDELVNWYLKEIEGEIETVQELTDKKLLVEKVIDRLVHHVSHMTSKLLSRDWCAYTIVQDHVLLPLVMEEGGAEEGSEDNPYLVVHPNYVIES